MAYLPALVVEGQEDPVMQVVDEDSGEIVYTLRINGTRFRPKVFRSGTYTVRVGEGDRMKVLTGVRSAGEDDSSTIQVTLP